MCSLWFPYVNIEIRVDVREVIIGTPLWIGWRYGLGAASVDKFIVE
jgi:hypothetical protein